MFVIKSLFLSIAALCILIAVCVGVRSVTAFSDASTALRSQNCAAQLGIDWSVEDGATEELNAFQACVSK